MMNTNSCLFSNYLYTCLVDVIIIQARIHLYLQIPGTSKLQQNQHTQEYMKLRARVG